MNKNAIPSYIDMDRIKDVIQQALAEDLSERGDITTNTVVPAEINATAKLIAKANGVLAGLPFFRLVFEMVDESCSFHTDFSDGDLLKSGDLVMEITGPARSLLIAERTGLNLLCRLSGIATLTAEYVQLINGTNAVVLDTRKTTPGLRILEKYAVHCGGGTNHRIGLFDAFLIKENHIAMGGGITATVNKALKAYDLPVQVEVETLEQLKEAIAAGAHSVLLDNMSPEKTKEAVAIVHAEAPKSFQTESSGGITRDTIRAYAEAGVDRISTGALTHSAKALDMSLKIYPII